MTVFHPIEQPKRAVLGGGAWGTALASVMARHKKSAVSLWAREAETVAAINERHINDIFLPDIILPNTICATDDLAELADSDIILMVVPAQFARAVLTDMAPLMKASASLVLCAKGIEQQSLKLMSDVAAEFIAPEQIAVLSGPSFAADVARGLPTAVTLACADEARGMYLAQEIGAAAFRPYYTDDVIGAEIGGALKNVLAIACGIVAGKALGESARAAVTARGFAEMGRLGAALGARPETLGGLSGLGALILTCSSDMSRNFSLGRALGEGKGIDEILGARSSVSEGAMSAAAVARLAETHNLDMPICQAIDAVITGRQDIDTAIGNLLARPFTAEV